MASPGSWAVRPVTLGLDGWSLPLESEYPGGDRRRGPEGAWRHPGARDRGELLLPPACPRRVRARPSASGLVLEDEIGLLEPAAGLQQPFEQGGGDGERRVGHHPVGAARQPEIRSVRLDDDNVRPKSLSKITEPVGMRFDGDHPRTDFEQGGADRSMTCAYVEDQAARLDVGLSDETRRPSGVQFVPSPPR